MFGVRTWCIGMLTQLADCRVASGPFQGMRYVGKAVESAFFPKLMGTYEKELHGIWYRQIAAASSRWVVNIGAAEGYYAVGLLFSKATTTIICFEESAVGQSLIRA